MTQRPVVSIVITTRNRARVVGAAIESALALDQSRFDLEIVVVDDGSTDDTSAVLAGYPVTVVRTMGLGMAGARNRGLDAATGDFYCLVDDDDVLLPAAISAQLAAFDAHPEYAAVHGQAQMTTSALEPFAEPFPSGPLASGMIFERLLGYFPQCATILTRMDRAREAGAYDGRYISDSDWDWLLRIAKKHPVGAIEVPVLLFRQRDQAEEKLSWDRFDEIGMIFRRQTADLPLTTKLRLRPILWRHHGWCAGVFMNYARENWRNGARIRAVRSTWYACRFSLPHVLLGLSRSAMGVARRPRGASA